ncbi:Multidrug resistance protein MdtC [Kordia antarctica]|uniref:Multidrug resistance protein MdtC n=1 Tax=Kordia antarctica TaxID=1218801 RepID=A0A7L4ZPH4_9FLAO|nr:efflux RND transporter permease subunit [Kordia antarctica]QHI38411.1 Multidrug resistance protein MdtC [Kordia antarctica]
MIKFLVSRPIAVFMATLAFILLGITATRFIPTSLMPDIDIPKITVQLSYPNNTARELETNIVRLLRNRLLQINNLKDIKTETRDGFATLKLVFEYGTKTDFAFIEVNEKIDASLNYLPRDLERPKVIKASTTDIPILNLTIALKEEYSIERFLELSEFTETILKKRVEQLPNIALADMSGHISPEIIITPYSQKIRSLGIDNTEIINAIRRNNIEYGNLIVQNGIYQYNFKFSNPLRTKKDIENIYLNIHQKLFKLKDLAQVSLQPTLERGLVYSNGKRAIVLAIIKKADAKLNELKEELETLTTSLETTYPELTFSTNQDQTQLLNLSIKNLKSSLWIGSTLAILIMFLFLKDIKAPFVIALSIPISLIISMLFFFIFGLSINVISLSGLILGVGMMIDNSIIVIDNISQKLTQGFSVVNACVKGTTEIITPLITSVLTTCSVFLPLLFLSGITGALFYEQALAITISLCTSLLVSIIFIPVLYRQLKNKKLQLKKWTLFKLKLPDTENWYAKSYSFFFSRKWLVYSISILSTIAAVMLFFKMEYSQLPEINQNETIIKIDWNDNITVNESQHRIDMVLKNISNIDQVFSEVGEQQYLLQHDDTKSFSEAVVYIKSTSNSKLKFIQSEIAQKIETQYPKSNLNFETPKNIFQYIFGTNDTQLNVEVYSKSFLESPKEEKLEEINELLATVSYTEIPIKKVASIKIIPENVLLYNVNQDDIIKELKTVFREQFIDRLKTSQKFIAIKLDYSISDIEKSISQIFIKNKNNAFIPLKNLIQIQPTKQYKTITAGINGEHIAYQVNSAKGLDSGIDNVQNILKNNNDFNFRLSGSLFELKELTHELTIVIVVAILLLYFIMAAQFESLWQPLIILLEIPIDIGGALLLLWLFGGTINIMSAIGMVIMCGVIINDSILKIHTINMLRKQGLNMEEAVKKGGELRLKSILMTSLTTILALTPFLFLNSLGANLQKPLALTVIGGMIIGTFISLYFIPLMYSFLSKKSFT